MTIDVPDDLEDSFILCNHVYSIRPQIRCWRKGPQRCKTACQLCCTISHAFTRRHHSNQVLTVEDGSSASYFLPHWIRPKAHVDQFPVSHSCQPNASESLHDNKVLVSCCRPLSPGILRQPISKTRRLQKPFMACNR